MTKRRLLVIDDEADILEYVRTVAESLGYDVTTEMAPHKFTELLAQVDPHVVVLDILMPGKDGFELLRELAVSHRHVRLLIVSGSSDLYLRSAQQLASGYGIADCMVMRKPFRVGELRAFLLGENPVVPE